MEGGLSTSSMRRTNGCTSHNAWRGFGGGPVTLDNIEFDKQLDKISLWVESWDHETRCKVMELLLRQSNYAQMQFLWTVMQPTMHRDLMYMAKVQEQKEYVPISTHTSRDLKERMLRLNKEKFHRVQSAYLQNIDQVKSIIRDVPGRNGDGDYIQSPVPVSAVSPHRVMSTQPALGFDQPAKVTPSASKSYMNSEARKALCKKLLGYNSAPTCRASEYHPSPSLVSLTLTSSATQVSNSNGQPVSALSKLSRSVPSCPSAARMTLASRSSASKSISLTCSTVRSGGSTLPQVSSSLLTVKSPRTESAPNIGYSSDLRSSLEQLHSAPPCVRFVEMPVRRHIQEESSPWELDTESVINVSPAVPHDVISVPPSTRGSKRKRAKNKVTAQLMVPECRQLVNWFCSWTDLQRNEFLHKILLKLEPREHYFISGLLSVKQHIDIVALVPESIGLKIMSYMTPSELGLCCRVSKTWYQLCNNNDLWKEKCQQIKLHVSDLNILHSDSSECKAVEELPVYDRMPTWKDIYRDNKNLNNNWTKGQCNIVDCKGHTDRVLSVTFDKNRMATGSMDKTIRLWDVSTGHCIQTLRGHTKGIWCLSFFTQNLLISGSYDCTLRIWNLRDGTLSRTMLGHEGAVWAIVRRDNILASASQDRTAKVWDISRCYLMHTLLGHGGAIFCIDMDEQGKMVITGSADKTIRLWETSTGHLIKTIWVPQGSSIMSVSYSKKWLACSHSNVICLYNVKKGKFVKKFVEHEKRIETVMLRMDEPSEPEGHIVSAGQDGVLKYWDINMEKSVRTFAGHQSWVNCVHFDETRIASASYDNRIKVWDFTTFSAPPQGDA